MLGLDSMSLTEGEVEALADIASLRKKGRGFVLSNKDLLMKLSSYSGFAEYTKNSFRQIYRDQTKWFNIINKFNFIIVITSDDYYNNQLIPCIEGEVYIPLSEFENKESVIIAENSYDIKFFALLASAYMKSKGVKGISLSYRTVLGGGSTTYQVINDHQLDRDGPAICILDSDKKFPTDELGSTAKKVFDEVICDKLTKVIITSSREIENVIPFCILNRVFSNNKGQLDKIIEYDKFRNESLSVNQPIKYIDFKKGVKLSLANKVGCVEHKNFWSNIFTSLGITESCSCINLKQCTCYVVDGFGSDLLRAVVEDLESNPFCFSEVEDIYKEELSSICENIIPFILAPQSLAS